MATCPHARRAAAVAAQSADGLRRSAEGLPILISITGSREGLTDWQRASLTTALRRPSVTGIVHGDCVGADAEADAIARTLGLPRYAYPSDAYRYRAHRDRDGCVFLAEPAPPLQRNPWIIRDGEACVGLPRPRSVGTWHAIGIALKLARPLLVLGERSVLRAPYR
jgi:hypothetical protein